MKDPPRSRHHRAEFARNRQLFLTEQGYRYLIESRYFDEHGSLIEPSVWHGLLEETAG